jgi:hypothetical protein
VYFYQMYGCFPPPTPPSDDESRDTMPLHSNQSITQPLAQTIFIQQDDYILETANDFNV